MDHNFSSPGIESQGQDQGHGEGHSSVRVEYWLRAVIARFYC